MAENGYGPAPVAGHYGRIPNYGKTQVNPMGNYEPPACIQNAMMTKDKKPFTYTPGGLDLSQCKTPSMARRMARQRSLEEHEQPANPGYHPQGGVNAGYHPQGGANPGYHPQGAAAMAPPPPPPQAPAPPPPPPLVIQAPNTKSPKPIPGERPEIVIPEDPIRMLRKTNSPYHWEAEKAEMQKLGPVPKFQEKAPSPLTVQMAPSSFSQQPPQTYAPPAQNQFQRHQDYPYGNQNNKAPESPIHRPEAQYAHQKPGSPNVHGSPVSREALQRQDSQFNKSPQPFSGQSPVSNGSPFTPTPNNNWRQPERRDSPAQVTSPQSPPVNRNQFSPNVQQFSPDNQNQQIIQNQTNIQIQPNYQNQQNYQNQPNYQKQPNYQNEQNYQCKPNYQPSPAPATSAPAAFHTLPRVGARVPDNYTNNNVQNNVHNNTRGAPLSPKSDDNTVYGRVNTNRNPHSENLQNLYHNSPPTNQQPIYTPPWATTNAANNKQENTNVGQWKQDNRNNGQTNNLKQQYTPPSAAFDVNKNRTQDVYDKRTPNTPASEQPRYQSSMSIPITPRKQNQTPPEQNNNVQKEVVYVNQEPVYYCPGSPNSIPPWVKSQKEKTKTPPPEWVQKPLERRSAPRELYTPPRDTAPRQEPEWVKKSNEMQRNLREVISPPKYHEPVQPTWSTRPSDNRKSLPKDNAPLAPNQGARVIPMQIESDRGNQAPTLRIMINTNSPVQGQGQPNLSQPTQRIMRVLSPQPVRMDEPKADLPTLNRNLQNNMESQAKTRIIPIHIEGGGNGASNKRVYYHKFTQEAPPPRQSKAFRVLQIITGTQDDENKPVEERQEFSHL